MKFQMAIADITKLQTQLDALDKKLQKKVVKKALREALKPVKNAVATGAPFRSGLLRRSIKIKAARTKKGRSGMLVQISSKAMAKMGKTFYPATVIYGSKKLHRKPNDFMEKAFESTKEQVRNRAIDLLQRGIAEAQKGQ